MNKYIYLLSTLALSFSLSANDSFNSDVFDLIYQESFDEAAELLEQVDEPSIMMYRQNGMVNDVLLFPYTERSLKLGKFILPRLEASMRSYKQACDSGDTFSCWQFVQVSEVIGSHNSFSGMYKDKFNNASRKGQIFSSTYQRQLKEAILAKKVNQLNWQDCYVAIYKAFPEANVLYDKEFADKFEFESECESFFEIEALNNPFVSFLYAKHMIEIKNKITISFAWYYYSNLNGFTPSKKHYSVLFNSMYDKQVDDAVKYVNHLVQARKDLNNDN